MMTKVLKKSFACVLALVLCLTCMLGALTVSAATGSFAVKDASVTVGAETVDVEVTVTAPGVNELLMKVETEAGIATAVSSNPAGAALMIEDSDTIAITKYESLDGFADAVVVTVTITLEEGLAAGDYTVTAKLLSAADGQENLFEIDNDDATISVVEEVAEPTLTVTKGAPLGSYKAKLGTPFTYNFDGEVTNYGLYVWKEDVYSAEADVATATAQFDTLSGGIIVDANGETDGLAINNLSYTKMHNKFYVRAYVVSEGKTYYAEDIYFSYIDFLLNRAEQGNAKAEAILDLYYVSSGSKAFDEQDEVVLPDVADAVYFANTPASATDLGDGTFASEVSVQGSFKTKFGIYFTLDNAPAGYTASGAFVYKPGNYVDGTTVINAETADAVIETNSGVTIANFAFEKYAQQYVVVPYVVDADGNTVLGSVLKASYADFLAAKLNGYASNETNAQKAQFICDTYELIYGVELCVAAQ